MNDDDDDKRDASLRADADAREGPARKRGVSGTRIVAVFALLASAAAVALLVWRVTVRPDEGGARAEGSRREIALGRRGVAVLESGAELSFRGDEVTQREGDVFYRIERGDRFVVHTPAGDIEVVGTCFRVQLSSEASPGGAASSVLVYEGRVRAVHGSARVELGAGESARLDASGAARLDAEQPR